MGWGSSNSRKRQCFGLRMNTIGSPRKPKSGSRDRHVSRRRALNPERSHHHAAVHVVLWAGPSVSGFLKWPSRRDLARARRATIILASDLQLWCVSETYCRTGRLLDRVSTCDLGVKLVLNEARAVSAGRQRGNVANYRSLASRSSLSLTTESSETPSRWTRYLNS